MRSARDDDAPMAQQLPQYCTAWRHLNILSQPSVLGCLNVCALGRRSGMQSRSGRGCSQTHTWGMCWFRVVLQ